DEKQWSEEQDLARFLWDEAPSKQVDTPQLARFLWRDATPAVLPSDADLQWSEQAPLQAPLDPDQLVAGFYWQLRDYDEEQWSEEQNLAGFYWQLRDYDEKQWSEEQDLARFLWDEAPSKQVDTPQLARFLWRDATPTVLPRGPELQVKV
ncbi:MAG: hypothetical protein P8P91_13375, partial [Pseudomonadales bacterium]|nr:hypothetical protein [Pseudomonadales bacterium]